MKRTFIIIGAVLVSILSLVAIPTGVGATTVITAPTAVQAVQAVTGAEAAVQASSANTAYVTPVVNTSSTGVVTSPSSSIGVVLPSADRAPMSLVQGISVFSAPLVSGVVQTANNGYQVSQVISSASAPSAYSYKLKLPTGYSPYIQRNGSVVIEADSVVMSGSAPAKATTLGFIDPAWAKDANGVSVPSSYSIQGDVITQHVNLRGVTAYPVVADPKVTFGWVIYAFFSKTDLQNWLFSALFDSIGAAAGIACGYLTLVAAPAGATCAILVVFFWDYFHHLFDTAIGRNGGIVLEFTYVGSYVGYLYAGSWS